MPEDSRPSNTLTLTTTQAPPEPLHSSGVHQEADLMEDGDSPKLVRPQPVEVSNHPYQLRRSVKRQADVLSTADTQLSQHPHLEEIEFTQPLPVTASVPLMLETDVQNAGPSGVPAITGPPQSKRRDSRDSRGSRDSHDNQSTSGTSTGTVTRCRKFRLLPVAHKRRGDPP